MAFDPVGVGGRGEGADEKIVIGGRQDMDIGRRAATRPPHSGPAPARGSAASQLAGQKRGDGDADMLAGP